MGSFCNGYHLKRQTSFRPDLKYKARTNRSQPSEPEKRLWYEALSKKKLGYRFLRQKPIDRFIVDFYCHSLKLVIEIDGESHAFQKNYDQQRSQILKQKGIKVVRYTNSDVMHHLESVYEDLAQQIVARERELNKK